MRSFWDTRYDTGEFVYGKVPNDFFATSIEGLPPGRILLPGEGEGRNAVYAASLGWNVDAFDQSRVAVDKALSFMEAEGVQVNFQACGLTEYAFQKEQYDFVGLIFFHVVPELRQLLHHKTIEALKSGGTLLLEAFHTSQLGNTTGGPQALEMLFDKNTLLNDFSILEHQFLEEVTVQLNEGPFHQGEASLVRYIGKK